MMIFPYLIHNVLNMDRFQYLGLDNCVEVSVHKFKHKVDVYIITGLDDIEQLDYIIVTGEFL